VTERGSTTVCGNFLCSSGTCLSHPADGDHTYAFTTQQRSTGWRSPTAPSSSTGSNLTARLRRATIQCTTGGGRLPVADRVQAVAPGGRTWWSKSSMNSMAKRAFPSVCDPRRRWQSLRDTYEGGGPTGKCGPTMERSTSFRERPRVWWKPSCTTHFQRQGWLHPWRDYFSGPGRSRKHAAGAHRLRVHRAAAQRLRNGIQITLPCASRTEFSGRLTHILQIRLHDLSFTVATTLAALHFFGRCRGARTLSSCAFLRKHRIYERRACSLPNEAVDSLLLWYLQYSSERALGYRSDSEFRVV